jgi:hypothetical protein
MTVHGDFGPVAVVEGQVSCRPIESAAQRFRGVVYDFDHLWWTHTGMILLLQGVILPNLVGPVMTIIRGQHSEVWRPRPCVRDVRFVVQMDNPEGLSCGDIFQLAVGLGL